MNFFHQEREPIIQISYKSLRESILQRYKTKLNNYYLFKLLIKFFLNHDLLNFLNLELFLVLYCESKI